MEDHNALEEEGQRGNSSFWHCSCADGYTYHKVAQSLSLGSWAFTCRVRRCPGRARSGNGGANLTITTRHTCTVDPQRVELLRLRRSILDECMAGPIRMIPIIIRHRIQK